MNIKEHESAADMLLYVGKGEGFEANPRSLWAIAREIKRLWTKPYFGAVPYIQAMIYLESVGCYYGSDRGEDIVRYFLANASTWRGEDAKRIKAELKAMIK